MKKYYLKLFCFVLPIGLIAQNTKKDTIMVGLSIPKIIFAEEKEEGERLLSPNRIEKIDAINIINILIKLYLLSPFTTKSLVA